MSKHLIKLPDLLLNEFVENLVKGDVLIHGVGTFSITEYKKKFHIQKEGNGYVQKKGKKLSKINFRPDPELKGRVR